MVRDGFDSSGSWGIVPGNCHALLKLRLQRIQESGKFCTECQELHFPAVCPRCGAANALVAKFCGECGASIGATIVARVSDTQLTEAREQIGERRHLTVLFCDLVGSTAISARLDPEEWRVRSKPNISAQ